MMSKKTSSVESLMLLFKDHVDEDDIISAKLLSRISSKITKYRISKNMSQEDFANLLHVSQSMVSKIESCDYNFTIRQLVKLCNKMELVLNIDIDDKDKPSVNQYIIMTSPKIVSYEYSSDEIKEGYSNNKSIYESRSSWIACD